MEIKEFISETLTQIFEGIIEAQNKAVDIGGKINVYYGEYQKLDNELKIDRKDISNVEFELSVTKSGSNETKGGLVVYFGNIGVGMSKKTEKNEVSLNKIKFSIPVFYPCEFDKNKINQ